MNMIRIWLESEIHSICSAVVKKKMKKIVSNAWHDTINTF